MVFITESQVLVQLAIAGTNDAKRSESTAGSENSGKLVQWHYLSVHLQSRHRQWSSREISEIQVSLCSLEGSQSSS